MFVAEKMNHVSVIVLQQDLEATLEEIARIGVLHPARVEELEPWAEDLQTSGAEQLADDYARRRQRARQIAEQAGLSEAPAPSGHVAHVRLTRLADIDEALDAVEQRLQPLLAQRAHLRQQLTERQQMQAYVGALVTTGLPLHSLFRSTFLAHAMGTVREDQLPRLEKLLEGIPSVVFPWRRESGKARVLCIVLRRDRDALEHAIHEVSLEKTGAPEDLPTLSEGLAGSIEQDIKALEAELAEATARLDAVRQEVAAPLAAAREQTEAAATVLEIERYCRRTEKTCVLTGWIPCERSDEFVQAARAKTGGRAVIQMRKAEAIGAVREGRVDVPVLYRHPAPLKPFESLVETYAMPSYRMIDPTPFVAVTFLFMFGMMFGDVGHGLVLLILGLALPRRFPQWATMGKLGAYCGVSSMVFGVLYGSVFGWDTLLPAVWVRPLDGISSLFVVAIGFGALLLSVGIVLNIINAIRTRRILDSLFDTSGPLVGVVYWTALGLFAKALFDTGDIPRPQALLKLLAVLLVIFLAKGPLLRLLGREKRMFPEGVFTYLMESVIEVLEILMGYVANTVSFIRVAAFGLAHAGLFVAVFSLAEITAQAPGGAVTSSLVIVLGNVLIIALEGLVVTIQVLRLQYYEFFGKFFRSVGLKYQPVGASEATFKTV